MAELAVIEEVDSLYYLNMSRMKRLCGEKLESLFITGETNLKGRYMREHVIAENVSN